MIFLNTSLFLPPLPLKLGTKPHLDHQGFLQHISSLLSLCSPIFLSNWTLLSCLHALFRLMLPPRTPSPFFISTCETCNGCLFLLFISLKHFFFFFSETHYCPGLVHGFLGLKLFLPLELGMWSRAGQTELVVYFVGFIRREAFPFASDRAANKGSLRELVSIFPSIRKKLVWKQSRYKAK